MGKMISRFSESYLLLDEVEVIRWPDERALINPELLDELRQMFGDPIVAMLNGRHYQFEPHHQIPSMAATVPKESHEDAPSAFLLQA